MSKLISSIFKGRKNLPKYAGRGQEFKYWERFVERTKDDHVNIKVFKPLVGTKYIARRINWYYNEHRPWTREGIAQNRLNERPPKTYVEPIKEWQLFVGDRVQVLVGRDKGKIGEICEIIHERNWVFVEELHMKLEMRSDNLGSRTMERVEKPLLVNEVKLIDPSDMRATDVEWRYTEDGERVRVSARTGRIIPIPFSHESLWEDYTKTSNYQNSEDKDTPDDELTKITFKPTLCTFEEDICEKMGLKHEKKKERSFWY